ncbi:MAG: T9SS type A sorting domain-containing protein, partial [Bacteroidales bacterium]|nr:T9SS type A sorting domain-containing protein [Bacteroidales bacterium]
ATVDPFAESGYVDYVRFRDPRVISFFSIYNELQKTYQITHIVNDIGLTGVGDTAIRIQEFSNYYAYDDGTPEAGYGLSVKNAKAAVKFKLNTKDTLRQVQMYFNPTLSHANDQNFDLIVWKSIDPEEIIYTKRLKTEFTDGLYNFYTYDLDTSIVLANEFYIGFQQLNEQNLNVGFDYAIDSKEYLFFSINSEWNPSIYNGSLMIRPVFGQKMTTAVDEVVEEEIRINIYPNPLRGNYLNFDVNKSVNQYEVEIYSLTGQKVLSGNLASSMDVSRLNNGIYLVRILHLETGESNTQKLIIRR